MMRGDSTDSASNRNVSPLTTSLSSFVFAFTLFSTAAEGAVSMCSSGIGGIWSAGFCSNPLEGASLAGLSGVGRPCCTCCDSGCCDDGVCL